MDSKNPSKKVKLEYKSLDKDEKVNQFIFFNQKDTINEKSKYYKKSYKFKDDSIVVLYNFILPNDDRILPKGKFNYFVSSSLWNYESNNFCVKNNRGYTLALKLKNTKTPIFISGIFMELYRNKKGEIAKNEIIVEDTINDR